MQRDYLPRITEIVGASNTVEIPTQIYLTLSHMNKIKKIEMEWLVVLDIF